MDSVPMRVVLDILKDFGVEELTGTRQELVTRLCNVLCDDTDDDTEDIEPQAPIKDDDHIVLFDDDLETAFAMLCAVNDD